MTRELRWRILSLQLIATLVFAVVAGLAYAGYSFTHDQVTTQLTEQQIIFPPANSPVIKALPAVNAQAMRQYAGQQLTTGDQAETYANNFIAVHLKVIGSGKTYAYWSGIAINPTTPKAQAAKAEDTALTLFRGETLRSLLLNAWAFWFAGSLALYAAIALAIGALATFGAFLFEFFLAPRREGVVDLKGRRFGPTVPVS